MFRLNGDIIKQLENIYNIKFIHKYKDELKERILSFISSILKKDIEDNIFSFIEKFNKVIVINDNKPQFIRMKFINNHKIELFNSFNPIWYSKKEVEKHYSIKELNSIEQEIIRLILDNNISFITFIKKVLYISNPINILYTKETHTKLNPSKQSYELILKKFSKELDEAINYSKLTIETLEKFKLLLSDLQEKNKEEIDTDEKIIENRSYNNRLLLSFFGENNLLNPSVKGFYHLSFSSKRILIQKIFIFCLKYEAIKFIKNKLNIIDNKGEHNV